MIFMFTFILVVSECFMIEMFFVLFYYVFFFLFFSNLAVRDEDFWREKAIELHLRNEMLFEDDLFLRKSLNKLDKKYRKFMQRHSACFPRKIVYLYR